MREPAKITPDLIAQHGITPEEYQRILAILGREPNFTELGIFSVMWSEHCSYKSSRVHLKTLPTAGAMHPARAGRERRCGGHRRRAGHRVQDGEPQPSLVHRAAPGCGHGRGRHHPGHLHHGRAAHRPPGSAALRAAHRTRRAASWRAAWWRGSRATATPWGCRRWAASSASHETYAGNPLVNVFCLGIAPKDRIFLARASGEGNPVHLRGGQDGPGRDPRGHHGLRDVRRGLGGAAAHGPGGRPVPGEAPHRGLPGADGGRRRRRRSRTWGRRGSPARPARWPAAAGRGSRSTSPGCRCRETGMIPYEVMLSESQERMLLVVKRGPRAGGHADLREVGPGRRDHRPGDRGRPDAGEGRRRGSWRRSRRGPWRRRGRSTTGRWSGRRTSTRRSGPTSPPCPCPRSWTRSLLDAPGLAQHRLQAAGLAAVRPHALLQHGGGARIGRRRPAGAGDGEGAGPLGGRERPATPTWIPTRAESWPWPRRPATSSAPGRGRWPSPTA